MTALESVLKARFSEVAPESVASGETFVVIRMEPRLYAVEIFGRATLASVQKMLDGLATLRHSDAPYVSVLLIDQIDGYDTALREIYKDDAYKNRVAETTVVVTSSAVARMVISTMAMGAKLTGNGNLIAADSIEEGLKTARGELAKTG